MDDFREGVDDAADLHASIAEAFGTSDQGEREGGSDPKDSSAPHDPAPADQPSSDPAREANGRFAPKPAEKPIEGAENKPQVSPAAPAETAPAAATRPAPQSWSAETKQGWATLPPAIQDQVLKRESEVNTVLNDSANARRFTSAIEQIVTPHAALLQREGVDVPTAVSNLLSFHAFFDRDPAACIAHLQGLALQKQGRAPQSPAAPQRQAPQPDYRQVARAEAQAALTEFQQQQAITSEISSFAKANPHFENVKASMAQMIRSAASAGQELSMQDAYDKAIWADPTIRETLIAERTAPVTAEMQAQQAAAQAQSAVDQDRARVQRARAAGGSIRGAPGNTVPAKVEKGLRDEIAAHFG